MDDVKIVEKTADPLNMLGETSSGSGQETTERKDDVRVEEAMSHVHDHRNLVTKKDLANLKRNKYDKIMTQFKDAYVIQNRKTGQIVEIRALNSFHACNLIGWRPKNCKVIDVVKGEETKPSQENNNVMVEENEKKASIQNTVDAPAGVDGTPATDAGTTV